MSHRQYNSAGKQQLLLILVVCRLLGASANSVYQTLFSPPPHNSLGTRLAYPATLKVRGIAHVLNFPRTRNYPVISIQLWHHNVYLPLYHLCIFWPTMTFLWLCILLHPPRARYFWYESQDSCTDSRHFWCFLGKKKEFIQLQPDKSVVLPFVMDCKLETTDSESGWCSASCSVYSCFTPL